MEDFEYFMSRLPGNNIYIRATDEIYRTTNMIGGLGHFYFNATGINNELGTKKARIYGSKRIDRAAWSLLSSTDSIQKLYMADTPFISRGITRAYLDGLNSQRINIAADLLNINDNEYFLSNGRIYYRSDSLHPADKSIEWIADHKDHVGIEGFWNMWLYGASLKYFTKGFIHGGCHTLEVADLEVSYSATIGVVIASGLPEGGLFHNITSHHNEGDGIHIQGYNNTKLYNCISHNNNGDGIVLVPQGGSNSPIAAALINHCTSSENNGYGFKVYTQISWDYIYKDTYAVDSVYAGTFAGAFRFSGTSDNNSYWTLINNISSNNALGEFSLQDNNNSASFMFNGWFGQNNNLFNQYSGFSNIENINPDFVNPGSYDFHLSSTSPYIGAGVHTITGTDIDGDIRDQYLPDIGADEF